MTDALPPVRIVIADSHAVVRAGVKAYLHDRTTVRVVGETGIAADAISLVLDRNADVLLIDVGMPDALAVLSGLQSTRVKTIALVDVADKDAFDEALSFIDGLVLKQSHLERIFEAVHLVTVEGHSIRRERLRERRGKGRKGAQDPGAIRDAGGHPPSTKRSRPARSKPH